MANRLREMWRVTHFSMDVDCHNNCGCVTSSHWGRAVNLQWACCWEWSDALPLLQPSSHAQQQSIEYARVNLEGSTTYYSSGIWAWDHKQPCIVCLASTTGESQQTHRIKTIKGIGFHLGRWAKVQQQHQEPRLTCLYVCGLHHEATSPIKDCWALLSWSCCSSSCSSWLLTVTHQMSCKGGAHSSSIPLSCNAQLCLSKPSGL
jgi:hypothetical protein